jgi:hypothetical protein
LGFVKDNVYAATVSKTPGEFKAWITCWPVQKTDNIFQKVLQESEYHYTARPTWNQPVLHNTYRTDLQIICDSQLYLKHVRSSIALKVWRSLMSFLHKQFQPRISISGYTQFSFMNNLQFQHNVLIIWLSFVAFNYICHTHKNHLFQIKIKFYNCLRNTPTQNFTSVCPVNSQSICSWMDNTHYGFILCTSH